MAVLSCKPFISDWAAEPGDPGQAAEQQWADACCSGGAPNASSMRRELDEHPERAAQPSLIDLPMGEIIDHIVQYHHGYLRRELPRLAALVDRVVQLDGALHPALRDLKNIFADFHGDLAFHMLKEERVLFPALNALGVGRDIGPCDLRNPIAVMEREHDEADVALRRMRALMDDLIPPEDTSGAYGALRTGLVALEEDLRRHIDKENRVLFPKGLHLLTAAAGAVGVPTAR
jgi:regulator of cell morphogenesis and NO signaling